MIEQKPLTIILSGEHKHLFKKWVNALLILNDSRDSYFRLKLLKTKDGLFVRQLNDLRVTLVESKFDKKLFKEFTKEPLEIEIDLKAFTKGLNLFSKETDDLRITFDIINNDFIIQDDMTKATIEIFKENKIKTFPSPEMPESSIQCKVESMALLSAFKSARKISDDIIISQMKSCFLKFVAKDLDITFEQLVPIISNRTLPDVKSCYSTHFLAEIKPACQLNYYVNIELAQHMPIALTWYFGKNSYFKFFCSPRIECE